MGSARYSAIDGDRVLKSRKVANSLLYLQDYGVNMENMTDEQRIAKALKVMVTNEKLQESIQRMFKLTGTRLVMSKIRDKKTPKVRRYLYASYDIDGKRVNLAGLDLNKALEASYGPNNSG